MKNKKVAIIGSGGREHAIAWKFASSIGAENVYLLPGNGGTHAYQNIPIDINDFEAIKTCCEANGIDLIFVGPEVPLVNGIVNFFKGSSIQVFGPSAEAARLEGSKRFSKDFMQRYGVATAHMWQTNTLAEARSVIQEQAGKLVLKYDGLAAGKGVYVCRNIAEAEQALEEMCEKFGEDAAFLMEELLEGPEISIIGFTDGKDIQLLHPSQDHKQLLEGDQGPNTGGMGAFCPLPFFTPEMRAGVHEEIVAPTLKGIQAEGMDYRGVVYFGLIWTDNGPKLLEYNCRFGDPETEVLLPALKSDLYELTTACLNGTLSDFQLEMEEGYFVDVVLASGGYPKSYPKGYPISGIDAAEADVDGDVLVFHAGTKRDEAGVLVTNGGRVLNVVGHANTLEAAIAKAYAGVDKIHFTDSYHRKDIGQRSQEL